MNVVPPQDRDHFRSELTKKAEIQESLSVIEDCDWDLETAAKVIALNEGYDVDTLRGDSEPFISQFLLEQAADTRDLICSDAFKDVLVPGLVTTAVSTLAASAGFSAALALPLVLFLVAFGTEGICKSNSTKG